MIAIIDQLALYFTFANVRYAMVVGILIALCASLLGVTLVLKRYSFIGMGLSNLAFGATAIAAAISLTNSFLLVLPITVASAVFLMRTGQSVKVKGDAALAMIAVGSLGIGYLILNIFPPSGNLAGDVCTILFGAVRILTLTRLELWISIGLSALVIVIFLLLYNKILAVTFDEDFALATGVKAKMYNTLLAVVIGIVIAVAMNLVGALLISALVIFPALSAMRVFKTFKSVTVCSVAVSVTCAALGILISIISSTPVGSTIVAANVAGFIIFSVVGLFARKNSTA